VDNSEKVEQARALYDEGVFDRKIVDRQPLDLYMDRAILECGHQADVPRSRSYERWQCSECLKPYKPVSARRRYFGLWLLVIPLVFSVLWLFLYVLPTATESERKARQEKQQVLDRIEKLERRVEQFESGK
jgi:hypothetical protein